MKKTALNLFLFCTVLLLQAKISLVDAVSNKKYQINFGLGVWF